MQGLTPLSSPLQPAVPTLAPQPSPVNSQNVQENNPVFKPLDELDKTERGENRRGPDNKPSETERQKQLRDAGAQDTSAGSSNNNDVSSDASGSENSGNAVDATQSNQQQSRAENRAQAELDAEIQRQVQELAARDREVRNHEQAHSAVGGQYAGPAQYRYERGPDGRSYAVSGEVSIDVSKIPDNPQATLIKAEQIRRAALAPAEPSPQDRQVAAQATQIKIEARSEILQDKVEARQQEQATKQNNNNAQVDKNTEDKAAEEAKQKQENKPNAAERFAELNKTNLLLNQRFNTISTIGENEIGRVNQLV